MIRVSPPPCVEYHAVTDRVSWLAHRQRDVTASVIGALLGVHEYVSPFGLWAVKSGTITEDPDETPAMRRGRLLEPVALRLLAEERPGWKITEPRTYYRDPAARIGATPDSFAIDPDRPGFGVVQIKTVEPSVFRRKWNDQDDEVRPPLWIVLQAVTEAHLTGAQWAVVVAMTVGFGLDLHVVEVPIHGGIMDRLKAEVATFWQMVENGTPPDPDFGKDGSLIARLYAHEDGREIDLSADNRLPEILAERARLTGIEAQARDAERERAKLDTEILARLGTASRGRLADGTIISAPEITRRGRYQFPVTYRAIRITAPRGAALLTHEGPF